MSTMDRAPPGAKARARGEPSANHHAALVADHATRPVAMAARLFPDDPGLADRLQVLIGDWRYAYPDPGATEYQAAAHEAAHFAMAEAVGLYAHHAQIYRPRRKDDSWCGAATAGRRPLHDGRLHYTAADVRGEACFCLAGPLAEQILAGGDAYATPGELLEVVILAARAADMRGEDRAATLHHLWARTTKTVIGCSEQIERIAARLKSASKQRCGIFRNSYGIPKVLSTVRILSSTRMAPLTTAQSNAMSCLFHNTPVDLVSFVEEVGR